MKTNRFFASFVISVFCSVSVFAGQHAIGVNIGSGLGISYQQGLGANNMLDVAVHLPYATNNGIGIGGIVTYDWIDPAGTTIPWTKAGEWHWYTGVGVAGGVYNFINPYWYAGVAAHVGIAYNFEFPLQISIDWRPNIGVRRGSEHTAVFNTWGLYDNISIGFRYTF